ncbi:Ig-like domain-containing protein [Bacteroides ovatus]|nr:Ig-like domain-containing protein [Bacteroides ovatus]
MKAHLFSKMSQGLLLLSALLATSCKESSNNFFVPDHEAPSLVSVTPANGETAEENNTILLTFNEYVKAGEGKANFNGEEVELTFKGKTASYAYTALDYNQACQFSLPKGAVIDFQGNVFEGVSIQFTIRERPQPEARIFDAVVSPDGKGNYTSIQKAIDNVPSKRTEPLAHFRGERNV